MKMNSTLKWMVATVIMGLWSVDVKAVPLLGEIWGSGNAPNWQTADLVGSIPLPTGATVNEVGTSVTLEFPTGGSSPYASLSTSDAYYQGSYVAYGPDLYARFTFDPVNYAPNPIGGLALYFQSGGNIWYANGVTTPLLTGPQTYTVNIGSLANWTPEIGNLANWATAWGSVDEIGFTILGPNGNNLQQQYTFSNIEIFVQVPEPESIWMIAMVLASLGIVFRGRLGQFAGQIKARIKS